MCPIDSPPPPPPPVRVHAWLHCRVLKGKVIFLCRKCLASVEMANLKYNFGNCFQQNICNYSGQWKVLKKANFRNTLIDSALEKKACFLDLAFLRISYLGLLYIWKIIVSLLTFWTPSWLTVGRCRATQVTSRKILLCVYPRLQKLVFFDPHTSRNPKKLC